MTNGDFKNNYNDKNELILRLLLKFNQNANMDVKS